MFRYLSVPHFDGVVSQARDNLGVVILEAVHALAVLAAAVDSLEVVFPTPPVVLDGLERNIILYAIKRPST